MAISDEMLGYIQCLYGSDYDKQVLIQAVELLEYAREDALKSCSEIIMDLCRAQRERNQGLISERDAALAQAAHWKANHDNVIKVHRQRVRNVIKICRKDMTTLFLHNQELQEGLNGD